MISKGFFIPKVLHMYVHICTYLYHEHIYMHTWCINMSVIIYKVYDVIYSVYESLMYSVHYMKT